MKNSHKITIALLTYNRCGKGLLKEALDAILVQTYRDFELLVVDNHSTDRTAEMVIGYEDPRLTYIRLPAGGNPTTSYIRSALMSRGDYVIFAHDDDIMESTMIERQLKFIEAHKDILIVSSNVSLIDQSGKLIQPRLYDLAKDQLYEAGDYIKTYLEEKLWMPAPTLLFNRKAFIKVVSKSLGTRDPEYLPSGDIWLALTLNLQGPIALIADPLLRYRQHGGQESRNVDQGVPMIEAIELLLKNHGRNKNLRRHLPAIHAFLARFGAQKACFTGEKNRQLVKELADLKRKWERAVSPQERALDMALPFEILLRLEGMEATISPEEFRRLEKTPAKGGARRGFRAWLNAILSGYNIFDSVPHIKRIGILGSMLNAYLIVESAAHAGVDVVGCFDSSPRRINQRVLGIPVLPIGDLASKGRGLEAIILSSEHDQEDALRKIINQYLPEKKPLPVISWKEMANKASSKQECI